MFVTFVRTVKNTLRTFYRMKSAVLLSKGKVSCLKYHKIYAEVDVTERKEMYGTPATCLAYHVHCAAQAHDGNKNKGSSLTLPVLVHSFTQRSCQNTEKVLPSNYRTDIS